jgi:hypothetical protein
MDVRVAERGSSVTDTISTAHLLTLSSPFESVCEYLDVSSGHAVGTEAIDVSLGRVERVTRNVAVVSMRLRGRRAADVEVTGLIRIVRLNTGHDPVTELVVVLPPGTLDVTDLYAHLPERIESELRRPAPARRGVMSATERRTDGTDEQRGRRRPSRRTRR